MKPGWMIGLSLAALCGASMHAHARPPTVMNSPGYDRRLQESRSQFANPPAIEAPATTPAPAPKRRKTKRAK